MSGAPSSQDHEAFLPEDSHAAGLDLLQPQPLQPSLRLNAYDTADLALGPRRGATQTFPNRRMRTVPSNVAEFSASPEQFRPPRAPEVHIHFRPPPHPKQKPLADLDVFSVTAVARNHRAPSNFSAVRHAQRLMHSSLTRQSPSIVAGSFVHSSTQDPPGFLARVNRGYQSRYSNKSLSCDAASNHDPAPLGSSSAGMDTVDGFKSFWEPYLPKAFVSQSEPSSGLIEGALRALPHLAKPVSSSVRVTHGGRRAAPSIEILNEPVLSEKTPAVADLPRSCRQRHQCDICMNWYANLETHKLIHASARPFKCTECSKEFSRMNDMLRHKRTHDTCVFRCPYWMQQACHRSGNFSRGDTYKRHMMARHFVVPEGTVPVERQRTTGRCKACGHPFASAIDWMSEHIDNAACPRLPDDACRR